MLTVETIGRIRREHFIKGKTIKEIARVQHPSSTNETFSPDRSLGDGQKNSTHSWPATRPSLLASS